MPKRALVNVLREMAPAGEPVPWTQFTRLALYHPELGYYRQPRERVGFRAGSDFYTAASLGTVFRELVAAAAVRLLGGPEAARDHAFVEVGAEPGQAPGPETAGRFAAVHALPPGTPPQSLAGGCPVVVFANEVLDAQPFHRFQLSAGTWREMGVRACPDGSLEEVPLPAFSEAAGALAASLPVNGLPEGCRLDLSLEAEDLLGTFAAWPRARLLVFADYGRTLPELLANSPKGTARAYRNHRLSTDLLADPGECDLTCHVAWDRLEATAREQGWAEVRLERQEAFFMHHAPEAVAAIIEGNPETFDPRRQTLQELLSPQHMGSKFQVLWARREA
jgi:SAM-dependent MidA family methyltransferase